MAGEYDFTILQGATFDRNFYYKDGNGDAIDLTDYTARMQIRNDYDEIVELELTTENGRLAITAAEGKIRMLLTATETAALSFIDAKYDLELVYVDGTITRLLEGTVTLSKEITK
jgi:hypothetical protein